MEYCKDDSHVEEQRTNGIGRFVRECLWKGDECPKTEKLNETKRMSIYMEYGHSL
jgi:hypothetical protein